ncbi:MAG: arsenosugar biosynthesis radical SAM protein ArsS [Gammaproteobacteria bacterium]|nr:arsenosugar biosynthesis radical SAM protein ArsS [Gammaproteobacteria bacterium]
MHDMLPLLHPGDSDFPPLKRAALQTLQVNLGYLCNQQCQHCHINAGPNRTEVMDATNIDTVLRFLEKNPIKRLDLTGGAPEMNPHFRRLVSNARQLGVTVLDRCNLTVLEEPGQEGLAEFLAEQRAEVVASLPCYLEENVNGQRGKGVFDSSIRGLQRLNALGYGDPGSGLELNLMYNPTGPFLPPAQEVLARDYRRVLGEQHGVRFNRLLTLVNMPIQRFGSMLVSTGQFDNYMQLLRENYAADNLPQVMCRHLISVDWQGRLYDCDFNQVLGLPLSGEAMATRHLSTITAAELEGRPIAVADHCYGCTAGHGSSCGGALS